METTAWTYTPPARAARRRLADRYLTAFGGVLLGYALFSRPFAYIGVAPLFIGEGMLLGGLVLAAASGRLGAAFSSGALRFWAVLLVWVLVRTVPYLGTYGLDGPRDAMIVAYGLFAVVLCALLLADPERLRRLVEQYATFVTVMLAASGVVYLVAKQVGEAGPTLPWAPDVGLFNAKGGDLLVHMTGIVGVMMLGMVRTSPLRWGAAVVSTVLFMASNRGGMLAFLIGLGAIWVLRPRGASLGRFGYALAILMVIGIIIAPMLNLKVQGGTRDVSVEQIVDNVKSVFGSSGQAALDGSRRWRIMWWTDIVNYTVRGPYFLTGKGFGINLATADGYQVEETEALRSPHNGHLTILARSGVPGAVLWLGLHLTWLAAVLGAWARAKRDDRRRWMALFAWLVGFWLAALINASFDVFLEGPMGGIWVWTVMGVGLAAVRIARQRPDLFDALDVPLPDPHALDGSAPSGPAFGW